MLEKMFPNAKIGQAVSQANQILAGTGTDFNSVSKKAKELGMDSSKIEEIYKRVGHTPQAKAICGMFGFTPESIRDKCKQLANGTEVTPEIAPRKNNETSAANLFPRIKR